MENSFQYETLYPFVIQHAEEILTSKWEEKTINDAVKKLKDGDDEIDLENAINLVRELTENRSENIGLKTIQGFVYNSGYENGELKSHVFPDVPKCFELWAKSRKIAVYSTGSIDSQKQLFSKSVEGDLTSHIFKYYDQTFGPKTEADSYKKIIEDLNVKPEEALFITDLIEEGQAAKAAGLSVALVVREGNNKLPEESKSFTVISSFKEISFDNPSKRKNTDETAVTEEPPSKVAKTEEADTSQSEDKQDKTEDNKTEGKESEKKVETEKKVEKTEIVEDEAMEVDAPADEIKEKLKKEEQKSDAPEEITNQETVTKTDDSLEKPIKKTDPKPVLNEDEPMDSADSTVRVSEKKSEVVKSSSENGTQVEKDKNEADSLKNADTDMTKKVEEIVKTEKTKDTKSKKENPKVNEDILEAVEKVSKIKDTVISDNENKEKLEKEKNKDKETATNGGVTDIPGETMVEADGQCDKNAKIVEKPDNEVDSTIKDVKEIDPKKEEKKQVESTLNNKAKKATEVIDDKVDSTEKVYENITKETHALEAKKVVVDKSTENVTEKMKSEEADSSDVKASEKTVEEKVKEPADKSEVDTSKSDVPATIEADAKEATAAKIVTDNTDNCESETAKDLSETNSDEMVSSSGENAESVEITKALPNKEESTATTKSEEKMETTTAKTEPETKSDAEEKENKKDLANGVENGDSIETKIATNGDSVDEKVNGESNETRSNGKELESTDGKIEEIKVKKVEASTASAETSAVSVEV